MIKNILLSLIIGAALLLGAHFFVGYTYSKEASLDILLGAILEFFILQSMLFFYNQHQDHKMQQHLADHLDKIEQLLKKAYATIKEKE